MKIVIPMAGLGKRFLAAGHQIPKTLIQIEGRPVVEHVIRQFSPTDDFVFGINEEHAKNTPLKSTLQALAPHSKTITMPYEKAGPIATVNRLVAEIKDEEQVIVNYCDFSWVWDYEHFKKTVAANDCDGAVVCYRGFHPHLLGTNQYATLDADGLWMKEIREKHSWHDNKQKDWTSSGTYYFKKGASIKKYFKAIESYPDQRINGEHYVSQIYQLMKADGLKVFIYEIPYMLQWGTPEDMEEYLYWSAFFRSYFASDFSTQPARLHSKRVIAVEPRAQSQNITGMQVLILMAGAGKRFAEAGYVLPKPYIPVDGGLMVERSAKSLPQGSRTIFVTRDELRNPHLEKRLHKEFDLSKIISLNQLTEGQAATALCAKSEIDLEKQLLIGACDHQVFYDEARFKLLTATNSGVDALIFTYRNNPNVRRNPQAYGWVDVDSEGRVKNISVKKPLPGDPSKNHAIIGSFWFRKGRYFSEQAERMIQANSRINNEFYIDQAMNFLVEAGLKVHVFEVDAYASWGTPDDLKTYEYWQKYFDISASERSAQPAHTTHDYVFPSGASPQPAARLSTEIVVSVVIPSFNEIGNLPGLIGRIQGCVEKSKTEKDFEWILVDNGSKDGTWQFLQQQAAVYPYIKPVRIDVNIGYGNGILAGLRLAVGSVLAWTHADCQTDPEDVLRAYQVYKKESQATPQILVKGARQGRPLQDRLFSGGMQAWASLTLGVQLSEVNAQPKLFPRALLAEMKDPPLDFSLDLYLLYLAREKGYRIVNVPVDFKPRQFGEAQGGGGSLKNRWKLIKRTADYIFKLRQRLDKEKKGK